MFKKRTQAQRKGKPVPAPIVKETQRKGKPIVKQLQRQVTRARRMLTFNFYFNCDLRVHHNSRFRKPLCSLQSIQFVLLTFK